jgi:ectoine hydroxylase-related dioxygenase (phytanoyl-CoA dioxygenase family)
VIKSSTSAATALVGDEQRNAFAEQGFFILPGIIDGETLHGLRATVDRMIVDIEREMDAAGVETLGLNHRGSRYFIANRYAGEPALEAFVTGELMLGIAAAVVGPEVYLFNEQFVVKTAEHDSDFAWHQDSGYLAKALGGYDRPYLTCWCALDDVTVENGTIHVLPFDRAGFRGLVDHDVDAASNDHIGYRGDDPGDAVEVAAGSIVVFSSMLLHRSGPNRTSRPRRSYVVQYTDVPVLRADGTPLHVARPVVSGGLRR